MQSAVSVPSKPTPKARRGQRRERNQAIAIQRILVKTIEDEATIASARASCAAAWARVADVKRILDGRPLPGALRPELAALRALRSGRQSAHKALLAINPADLPQGT